MQDTRISIPVDTATAQAYQAISAEEQRKIELLLGVRMRELLNYPSIPLSQLMDEIGHKAEASGLTPEILENLLRDE
ncbi:hypothetical protein [Trichothermofontia sp.]